MLFLPPRPVGTPPSRRRGVDYSNSSFKRGEAPLNYHFVTSDTMYFLIAENRLFGSGGQVERKGRLPNLLINSDTDR